MRFKEFLLGEANFVGPGEMSIDEMIDWVSHNALNFIKMETPIYRGVRSDKAEGLYHGSQLNRKAANTHNFVNLWMSNDYAWSAFPSRSKSFICSTNESYSRSYGTRYCVIPSDSSKIGICPAQDLWESFPIIDKITGYVGFDYFMHLTQTLLSSVSVDNADDDWDKFRYGLNLIDVEHLAQNKSSMGLHHMLSFMTENHLQTFYELYEKIFQPSDFSLEKASSFNAPADREVWMSGSILMVNAGTYRRIKSAL